MKKDPSIKVSKSHTARKTPRGKYECVTNPKTSDHKHSNISPTVSNQSVKTNYALRRMKFDKENAVFQKMAADVFDDDLIKMIESASDKQLEEKATTARSIITSRLPTSTKRVFLKNMLNTSVMKNKGGSVSDTAGTFALILAQRGLEKYLKASSKNKARSNKSASSVVRKLRTIA